MLAKCIVAVLMMSTIACAEEPKPPIPAPLPQPVDAARPAMLPNLFPRQPDPEWTARLERLRLQPRAGEISIGAVDAAMTDIYVNRPEAKVNAAAILNEYDAAINEMAAKWEKELNERRAQFEARLLLEIPEAKREQAAKVLELSHAKWIEASEREAKMRAEFAALLKANPRTAPGAAVTKDQLATKAAKPQDGLFDAAAWTRDERSKATKKDQEAIQALRALLAPDEAEKFDKLTRGRGYIPTALAPTTSVGIPSTLKAVKPPTLPPEKPANTNANPNIDDGADVKVEGNKF